MGVLYNRILRFSRGYRHFHSLLEDFYLESDNYRIASVNNHALDLTKMGNCLISRFIRDPRDLVVSAYFYHKRGAETWCNIVSPSEKDWAIVNGLIPKNMGKHHSFSTYLKSLTVEDGLLAEIEFRENHFDSMLEWPTEDPRIRVFRYEDIIGNEQDVFADIFSFYGLSWPERQLGVMLAGRLSARKLGGAAKHIRNFKAGQWKEHFTPKVSGYFEKKHGTLLERYGYE